MPSVSIVIQQRARRANKSQIWKGRIMSESRVDIHRARELVEQISENLASLRRDSPDYAKLCQEVEDLRAMLNEAEAHLPKIEERMKSVHGTFDRLGTELRADGIRAGVFLSEMGRILGLE